MKRILYQSQNRVYKSLFGALKTQEACTFCVDILKSELPKEVFFICRRDEEAQGVAIPMMQLCTKGPYLRFSCCHAFSEAGLYFYRFEFTCPEGVRFCGNKQGNAEIEDWLPEWQLTVYDKDFHTPDWAKGGVMYQIFPDRFARSANYMLPPVKQERKVHENWFDVPDFIYDNPAYKGNDFFCGNLQGILERLDYLSELGVTVLYLNPIFESPENHRYSTADYTKVDGYLGTNEDFARLCKACKSCGIRVVLDGVFSHTGADSVYFNKFKNYDSVGAYQGKASPYYDWYQFYAPGKYDCWWGFDTLPNVKETQPDYLEFITGEQGVLSYWQSLGAGGWRLDVADELPDAFLDALRRRVKATDDQALIIGEVWEDATNKFAYGERRRYLLGKQLDSVMNYPWRTAIIEYVLSADAPLFCSRIKELMEHYPKPSLDCLMNLLSSHDTSRILNVLGVKKHVEHKDAAAYQLTEEEYSRGKQNLMAASFLQFALPGIPCTFYGDEVGLCGFHDPYCRMGYPYGKEDNQLLLHFQTLGTLRSTYRQAFQADCSVYAAGAHTVLLCRDNLFFVMNLGDYEENMKFSSDFVTIFESNSFQNYHKTKKIPPKSYVIFQRKSKKMA